MLHFELRNFLLAAADLCSQHPLSAQLTEEELFKVEVKGLGLQISRFEAVLAPGGIAKRHILVFMLFWGIFSIYAVRACISVAAAPTGPLDDIEGHTGGVCGVWS